VKLFKRSFVSIALVVGALAIGAQAASAATSTATLTAGTLSITAAASDFSYGPAALTGDAFTLPSSFAVSVDDATGSKAGWNLQATIGTLTNVGSDTIAASGHTIQSVAVTGVTGTAPTNSIAVGNPIPTSAAKIFNAAVNTGKGRSTETFTTQLAIPADTAAGTYSAVMTVSIVSGP
jgi:hypothetical protein